MSSRDTGDVEIERQDETGWDRRSGSQTADGKRDPASEADVEAASDAAAVRAGAKLPILPCNVSAFCPSTSPQEIYVVLTCYTDIRYTGLIPDTHGPVFMEVSHRGVENRADVHGAFPHIIENYGGEREGSTEHAAEGPSPIYRSKKAVLENRLFGWVALHVGS